MPEAEMLCNRILILDRGRIAASDTPDGLRATTKGSLRIVAEIRASRRLLIAKIEAMEGVGKVSCVPDGEWSRVICDGMPGFDLREPLFDIVKKQHWGLRELRIERRPLEEAFSQVTEASPEAPQPEQEVQP
jgi:ABC-2 type transport system ATP-binding protein